MTNQEYRDLMQNIFDAWDKFAEPGRENLTVPELARRMETYRTQFYGQGRTVPHEFGDDVKQTYTPKAVSLTCVVNKENNKSTTIGSYR